MTKQTAGQLLRLARTARQMSLEDVEKETGIESPYLLAMELDQTFALPAGASQEEYLLAYAGAVGLSLEELHREEEASVNETSASSDDQPERPVRYYQRTQVGTSGRQRKRRQLPLLYVGLMGLAILLLVTLILWAQFNRTRQAANSEQTIERSSEDTQETSSKTQQSPMTVTPSEDGLTMSVKMARREGQANEIEVALSGADDIYTIISNTDLAGGIYMMKSGEQTSVKTAVLADATTSQIALTRVEGITITINGQTVDTSSLNGTGNKIINVTLE